MNPHVLVIQNSPHSRPGRLPAILAEAGVTCDIRLGWEGIPQSLDGYHGLVMLGGGLMPDDDERAPWLPTERALAASAMTQDLPTLGICLGGQLLAHVAGGEVRANTGTPEQGATTITATDSGRDDPLTAVLANGEPMIEHHRDMITVLPPTSIHLATSENCAHQAFRLGQRVWGVQFHPELPCSVVAGWDPDDIIAAGYDQEELIRGAEQADEANVRAAHTLLTAFATVVRTAAA